MLDGELGILPQHAPLVGVLGAGELRLELSEDGAKRRYFVTGGGFVEVLKNRISILVTSLEDVETLELADAKARLDAVLGERPQTGDFDVIEAYQEDVRVARARVRLLG